jgi:uncharacterized damage-inducible protein DinB
LVNSTLKPSETSNNMEFSHYAKQQYQWVQSSRQVLFDYCKTVKPEDFTNQNTSFGQGDSMRNLLVHNANTYAFWVGKVALGKALEFAKYEDIADISAVMDLFEVVNVLMLEFFGQNPETQKDYEIRGVKGITSVAQIFTHVTTHEFHHKGQILSISRHLGYVPVDTDIIR